MKHGADPPRQLVSQYDVARIFGECYSRAQIQSLPPIGSSRAALSLRLHTALKNAFPGALHRLLDAPPRSRRRELTEQIQDIDDVSLNTSFLLTWPCCVNNACRQNHTDSSNFTNGSLLCAEGYEHSWESARWNLFQQLQVGLQAVESLQALVPSGIRHTVFYEEEQELIFTNDSISSNVKPEVVSSSSVRNMPTSVDYAVTDEITDVRDKYRIFLPMHCALRHGYVGQELKIVD